MDLKSPEGPPKKLCADLTSSKFPQSDYTYAVKMINNKRQMNKGRVESAEHGCCSVFADSSSANKEQQALLLFN